MSAVSNVRPKPDPVWHYAGDCVPSCSSVVGSLGVEVLGRLSSGRTVSCFYGKRVTDTANFYLYGKVLPDVVQWAQAAEVSLQPTLELEIVS